MKSNTAYSPDGDSVTIVGGGITGLCAAYYLVKEGYHVSVIDKNSIDDGCSFGNMGFLSPSHFIPLASPGIIAEGLKHIFNKQSPFYIKPRLNYDFLKWGWLFFRNSRKKVVDRNVPHLNDILQLSRELMNEMRDDLGDVFDMEEIGCLMMCKGPDAYDHELKLADQAEKLGLQVERLTGEQVQALEPDVQVNVAGAVLFKDDAHIDPGKFMLRLKHYLEDAGVKFHLHNAVLDFEVENGKINSIITDQGSFQVKMLVLASGSWLPVLTKKLGIRLLLQPGKGYSYTYDHVQKNIRYPAILVDGRCAVTPWKNKLRIGGTMEFSGLESRLLYDRMKGIYKSVKSFYPGLEISLPPENKIWTGLRPVTPDGLPYIGTPEGLKNLVIAGGHAMLGISEGAGTGQIIASIISGQKPQIDISAFAVDRF